MRSSTVTRRVETLRETSAALSNCYETSTPARTLLPSGHPCPEVRDLGHFRAAARIRYVMQQSLRE